MAEWKSTKPKSLAIKKALGATSQQFLTSPQAGRVTRDQASLTVEETLRRAKDFFKLKTREDILWVGPVQGGRHLDLVAKSALEMGKMQFQIHALGSPTEVMESYRFDVLVDMIMTAKKNLPIERPLHLFGAGHPIMFSLAVALGCDLFDSAAYALYAREKRYMTENGTWRLSELDYFPCQCPKCSRSTPSEVLGKSAKEQEVFLAEHNLYACSGELRRIKQAIRDGRLWEYGEAKAHAHPALLTAFRKLKEHREFIEEHNPTIKRRGLFFSDSAALSRPEVTHYRWRLRDRYGHPERSTVLLLAPQTRNKPFHKAREFQKIQQVFRRLDDNMVNKIHVCFYVAPFGVIPIELDEVYPLSQHETAGPIEDTVLQRVADEVASFISSSHYKSIVLLHDPLNWSDHVKRACKKSCQEKGVKFNYLALREDSTKNILTRLEMILKKNSSE